MTSTVDPLVAGDGTMRFAPLVLATLRELDPGSSSEVRHYAGLDLVTVMIDGTLAHDARDGRSVVGSDHVAVLSTGAGASHRVVALARCRALVLWSPARREGRARFAGLSIARSERIGRLVPLAGRGSDLALEAPVSICAGVLPVGTSLVHHNWDRSYLLSTVGRIAIDGRVVEPGDRVVLRGRGAARIEALESTEIITVGVER